MIASKSALAGLSVTSDANGATITDSTGADVVIKIEAQSDNTDDLFVEAMQADGTISGDGTLTGKELNAANEATVVSGDINFTTNEPTTTAFTVSSSSSDPGAMLADVGAGAAQTGTVAQSADKVSTMSINTVATANTAIQVIDAAIATISSTRADLGATQNRFDSIVSGLQVASDNQSAARSRIVDADFAQETATLTRGQILQQAGIAVLAQANAAPQNVLSLLQ